MINGRKAQSTITIIFIVLTFIIGWIFFLGDFLSYWGGQTVIINNLTGFEAFFYNNLNLLIGIGLLLFTLAGVYLGGKR
jgi:hypothetical protein